MNDDIITLDGISFPITGQIVAAAASDFEAGIKVGKVSYDNRENAFFLVLNDFTGGFGSRYLDIREELGTYWFAGESSPETSYAGRVTLPLAQTYVSISNPPSAFDGNDSLSYASIERSAKYLFCLGSAVYSISTLGATPTKKDDPGTYTATSIISAVDSTEGESRLYVARDTDSDTLNTAAAAQSVRMSLDEGESWNNINSTTPEFNHYAPIQGVLGQVIAQDTVMVYQSGTFVYTKALTTTVAEDVNADGTANDVSIDSTTVTDQIITVPRYNWKVIPAVNPFPNRVVDGGPFDLAATTTTLLIPYVTVNGVVQDYSYGANYRPVGPEDPSGDEYSDDWFVDAGNIDIDHGEGNGSPNTFAFNMVRNANGGELTYAIEWVATIPEVTSTIPVEDLFFWDHKVLGVYGGNRLVFLVPASGDGLNIYTLPAGTYITSLAYTTIGSIQIGSDLHDMTPEVTVSSTVNADGTVNDVTSTTTTTSGQVVITPRLLDYHGWVVNGTYSVGPNYEQKIEEGEEPWNLVVEGDEQVLAAIEVDRELRFVGVAMAPWGESAVYLRAGNKLYVLDFFSRKIFPIEIGSGRPIIQAHMWNGVVIWTDGWEVGEYNPQSGTNRNLGLPSKWGIPPSLVGSSGPFQISDIQPYGKEMIAIMVDPDEPATVLYKYNGIGWAQMGAVMHGFFGVHGFMVTLPLAGTVFTGRSQAFIVVGANAVTGATSFGYWQFTLPALSHQPTVGLDTFGASGSRFYTGWIDGGFFDIDGTLLRMNIDAFFPTTSEKIMVEYRLNNDATAEEDATWTQLVDSTGVADVFDSATDTLYFPNATAPKAGIAYRTVQFRITFIRGSTATNSPELRALTLTHLKTPELRTQWSFNIDVDRMTANNTGSVTTFYIDGAVATVENVWGKLRDLWTNDHTLIPMTVPSALGTSETLYVKLTAIPLSLDDFRASVDGRGTVQIQLVEPVN